MQGFLIALLGLVAIDIAAGAVRADESSTAHGQNSTQRVVLADPKMPETHEMDYALGAGLFKSNWVAAPASTQAIDGLGPLYNARSCNACHPGGTTPRDLTDLHHDPVPGLLLRLTQVIDGKGSPDPVYGEQLQTSALTGQRPEGHLSLTMQEGPRVTLADGTIVQLHRPMPVLSDLAFGALAPQTVIGLRIAPALNGFGLLQRIPATTILAAINHEKDVVGRANWVVDRQTGKKALGRFGWKATQPTLNQQNAHAFALDIGMSTHLFPNGSGDCTKSEMACLSAPNGNSPQFGDVEIADPLLALIDTFVTYARLPKPIVDPAQSGQVKVGSRLFTDLGCSDCHHSSYRLVAQGDDPAQTITPYTDLLLHHMGPDLADGTIEGEATGDEWRTAPLWGLGHAVAVDGQGALLHDGRAATILEAILWHGGQASAAQQRVIALPTADRNSLIAFLRSL